MSDGQPAASESVVCWLIERNWRGQNFYLVAEHYGGLDWTENPHKAQRFPTEEWARKFVDRTILNTFDDLRVEEHMFLAEPEATAQPRQEDMKAWCVDRPSGTLVVIGTRADAESRASVMKAAGKEELMLSGPYEFVIAVKP